MGTPHAAFHSAAHLAPMCQRTLMTGCQQESSLPRKLPRAGLHGPRQGHACCAHCHPASRSGKSHNQVFPWGKKSGLGSPQPPQETKRARARLADVPNLVPAGTQSSVPAVLVCFCMPSRQAWKRKRDGRLHLAPLSHVDRAVSIWLAIRGPPPTLILVYVHPANSLQCKCFPF